MADETFGISIIEAQASGLPVVGVAAGAMLDRVTDAMGRLGPVGEPDLMAANILEVWNSDRVAMGRAAREHALQFSWDSSMEALFAHVYPAAFERQRERQLSVAGAPMKLTLLVSPSLPLINWAGKTGGLLARLTLMFAGRAVKSLVIAIYSDARFTTCRA